MRISLDLLSTCPLINRFDAMLCSNLVSEISDAGHVKRSRGLQVPPSLLQILAIWG